MCGGLVQIFGFKSLNFNIFFYTYFFFFLGGGGGGKMGVCGVRKINIYWG